MFSHFLRIYIRLDCHSQLIFFLSFSRDRYWSLDILRFLHRGVALSSWQRLRDGEDISIEYALGAFDMLVMEDEKIDMHDVWTRLPRL